MVRVLLLAALLAFVAAEPDHPSSQYGAPPPPSYGAPPPPSYGPPPPPNNYCPKKCYDKSVYTTVHKYNTEHHTKWVTVPQYVPTTLYKYAKDSVYYPTKVVRFHRTTLPVPDVDIYTTLVTYATAYVTEAHISTVQVKNPGTHYYIDTTTETHTCTDTTATPYPVWVTNHVTATVHEPHTVFTTPVWFNYLTVTVDDDRTTFTTETIVSTMFMPPVVATVHEPKVEYEYVTHTKPTYTTVCPGTHGHGY